MHVHTSLETGNLKMKLLGEGWPAWWDLGGDELGVKRLTQVDTCVEGWERLGQEVREEEEGFQLFRLEYRGSFVATAVLH